MKSVYSSNFVICFLIFLSPISFVIILFLYSLSDEFTNSNYKIGWNNVKYRRAVKYGKLCTSNIINSTYYDIPNVCSLKCDLIPVPFPEKSEEKCLNQRKVMEIYNNTLIALENVKIIFTNTFYYNSHKNNEKIKYLKKGEKTNIEYEYITVESKDVDDIFLHFIPTKLNKIQRKSKQYNINLYLFDGMSRSQFNEQMNNTISFLNSITDEFDIFEYFRYHSIGMNSIPNYIPIFYGTTSRRATWLNEKDDILKHIYDDNYKTLFFDQFCFKKLKFYNPHVNHKGFDHEFHIGCLKSWFDQDLQYHDRPRCAGSKQIHEQYLPFQEEAMKYYYKHNQLMFSLHLFSETHDPDLIAITRVDYDYAEHLKRMKEIMKDSITVIFGDHGIHYGQLRKTEYGESNRALPVMIIIVPKSFSKSYPSIYESMRINQNRFSTHFEFHETLNDIIRINENKYVNTSKYSLFREIPKSYSCEKAKVNYYCACR